MYDYLYYKPLIQTFLSAIKDKHRDNLVSAVLFGSIARGEGRKESDIDLLVILEEAPDIYYERLKPFVEIGLKLEDSQIYEECMKKGAMPFFSYLILSRKEANENRYIFLDMIDNSIVLYDKNDYFRKRLESLKQRLSFLGSKRVFLEDGTWYWDLKPDLKMGEEFVL